MADDEEYEEVVEYYTEEVVYEEVPGETITEIYETTTTRTSDYEQSETSKPALAQPALAQPAPAKPVERRKVIRKKVDPSKFMTPYIAHSQKMQDLFSPNKYKEKFEKTKGRPYASTTDTPELRRIKKVQDQLSEVKYRIDGDVAKTICHVDEKAKDIEHAKKVSQQVSKVLYKQNWEDTKDKYLLPPDAPELVQAVKNTAMFSKKLYTEDWEADKTLFYPYNDSPELRRVAQAQKALSDVAYKKGLAEQQAQFTPLADPPEIEFAKKVTNQVSKQKYKEDYENKIKGKWSETPCFEVANARMNADNISTRKYQEDFENMKDQIYFMQTETPEYKMNKKAGVAASKVKYKEDYEKNKGKADYNVLPASENPLLRQLKAAGDALSDKLYKENYEKTKAKSINYCETPKFKLDTVLQNFSSDKKYKDSYLKNILGHYVGSFEDPYHSHCMRVTAQNSDKNYKAEYEEDRGKGFFPQTITQEYEAIKKLDQCKDHTYKVHPDKTKFTQVTDSPVLLQAQVNSKQLSDLNYKAKHESEKFKCHIPPDTPALIQHKVNAYNLSDNLYKQDWEKSKAKKFDIKVDAIPLLAAKANTKNTSDVMYKKDYEKNKGKMIGALSINDDPKMLHSLKVAKNQSDRLYKENYEKTKAKSMNYCETPKYQLDTQLKNFSEAKYKDLYVKNILGHYVGSFEDPYHTHCMKVAAQNSDKSYKAEYEEDKGKCYFPQTITQEYEAIKKLDQCKDHTYKVHPDKTKFTAVTDTPVLLQAQLNTKQLSDLNYKAKHEGEKFKCHVPADAPQFIQHRVNAYNLSDNLYKQDWEKSKAKKFDIKVDAIPLLAAKANTKNTSDVMYKKDYEKSKGKMIGALSINDDPKMLHSLKTAKNQSDREYRKDYEKSKTIYTAPLDMLQVTQAKKSQAIASDVDYKHILHSYSYPPDSINVDLAKKAYALQSDVEYKADYNSWMKGCGWVPFGSLEMEKAKRASDILNEKKYRQHPDTLKFTSIEDAPITVQSKINQAQRSDIAYKAKGEEIIHKYNLPADLPQFIQAKVNAYNISENMYKADLKDLSKKGYDLRTDAIPIRAAKAARQAASDVQYKKDYEKAKGKMVGFQSLQDDPKLVHYMNVAKIQSDREYKKDYEKTKTKYNTPHDMFNVVAAKKAQDVVSNVNYKHSLHHYTYLPDAMDLELSKNMMQIQSDNVYKEDYNNWMKGIGWIPIGSLDVEKVKKAGDALNEKKYRQHPDTLKFTSIVDSPVMVQAKQNTKQVSDILYKAKGEDVKHKYTMSPDLPQFLQAKCNAYNISDVCYKRDWHDLIAKGNNVLGDAIPITAAKASRNIASDYKYKEAYEKAKGKHVGFRSLQDDPKLVHYMNVAKMQSDREYKKNYENTKTSYHTPGDMVSITAAKMAQDVATNVNYKQPLHHYTYLPDALSLEHTRNVNQIQSDNVYKDEYNSFFKGIGWIPIGSLEVEKVKKAGDALNEKKYRQHPDTIKFTSLPDSMGMVLAQHNTKQLSDLNYKVEGEKLKHKYTIDPELPQFIQAKVNALNMSDAHYKADWKKTIAKGYDLRPDAIPIVAAKSSRNIASDCKYKEAYEKAKGKQVGFRSLQDDPKLVHYMNVAKMQSDREYKKGYEASKTKYHTPLDMVSVTAAKKSQEVATNANYRQPYHHYTLLPDALNVEHSRNAMQIQSDNLYKSDFTNWMKGIGWVPIESLEVEKAKKAGEILSEKKYRQHPEKLKFTYAMDTMEQALNKSNKLNMDKRLYTEKWNKDKTTIHVMPDTPDILLSRVNQITMSDKLYKAGWEEEKKKGYDLRPDAIAIKAARASRDIASDYKYKQAYEQAKGKHIGFRSLEDDPKLVHFMQVAKMQSDREYKKGYEKSKTSFHTPVDMLSVVAAKKSQEVATNANYRNLIHTYNMLPDAMSFELAKTRMQIQSDNQYKADYADFMKGIGWLPLGSLEAEKNKKAMEIISEKKYRQHPDTLKYSTLMDSMNMVLAQNNAKIMNEHLYKQAWEADKTKVHIMPDIPQIILAKANAINMSDKLYKLSLEESKKKGYDLRPDAIPIKAAKASRDIASDYKYKHDYEKGKGKMVGFRSLEDDPKLVHSMQVAKMQSDREYKKNYENTKTSYHTPADMLSVTAAKDAQANITNTNYKHLIHKYILLPDAMNIELTRNMNRIQSDNEYKQDYNEWYKGLGWSPAGSLEVEKAKKATEYASDQKYRQHPSNFQFKKLTDSMDMVLAKQNAHTMNKYLYTVDWNKDKTNVHVMPDTPDILQAKQNQTLYSQKLYKLGWEESLKKGYDLPVDAISVQLAKASRDIASDFKYKQGYRKQLGHHVGFRSLQDDPKLVLSMNVAKMQSEREYKKDFEKWKTKFSSPVDMLGVVLAKKCQELVSDVDYKNYLHQWTCLPDQNDVVQAKKVYELQSENLYKSDLEWLRGIGWSPLGSLEAEKNKRASEIISEKKYRQPPDRNKFTSIPDAMDIVLAKTNAKNRSDRLYREAWDKDKTQIHIMPDTPDIVLAKANLINTSDKLYRMGYEELKRKGYDLPVDAIPIKAAKASREIASEYKYKDGYRKQLGHHIGARNIEDDPKMMWSMHVAKIQSDREYKKDFEKWKTKFSSPVDMLGVVLAKKCQTLVSDVDYKNYLHQWTCLPDQSDVIHARQAYDLQSDNLYKSDLQWLKGIGWMPSGSLEDEKNKRATQILSDHVYRQHPDKFKFSSLMDSIPMVLAKNNAITMNHRLYTEAWDKDKTTVHIMPDTPEVLLAKQNKVNYSEKLYKLGLEEAKRKGYDMRVDAIPIKAAKASRDIASEFKYKEGYRKQLGHHIGARAIHDDPKMMWSMHVAKIQSDREYKKDFEKWKTKFSSPVDMLGVVLAKKCQTLVSDVDYKNYLHEWTCLPDQSDVIHARQAYDLQSDNMYKSDLQWMRGIGWVPIGSLDVEKCKRATEILSDKIYRQPPDTFKFTSVTDSLEQVLAKNNAITMNKRLYTEAWDKDKTQIHIMPDTPEIMLARTNKINYSETLYKLAHEEAKKEGYDLRSDAIPIVAAKASRDIISDYKYKDGYRKQLGHHIGARNIEDDPKMMWSMHVAKIQSDREYKKDFEKWKTKFSSPVDMLGVVLAKKCQTLVSDVDYKNYLHEWTCLPDQSDVIHARQAYDLQSDNIYKSDLQWLRGIGWVPIGSVDVVKCKRAAEILSDNIYRQPPDKLKFTSVTDSLEQVLAKNNALNMNKRLYTEAWDKDKTQIHIMPDTPEIMLARQNKINYSETLYKLANEEAKKKGYDLRSDAIPIVAAKASRDIISDYKYKDGYRKQLGHHIGARNIEDDPKMMWSMHVAKIQSDREYKKDFEKWKTKFSSPVDMLGVVLAKKCQTLVSDVDYKNYLHQWTCLPDQNDVMHARQAYDLQSDNIYKSDLQWLRGIGWVPIGSVDVVKCKRAAEILSDNIYRQPPDKLKFTSVTDSLEQVLAKNNALNMNKHLYTEAWDKDKTQVHIMPDTPEIMLARQNKINYSENLYRQAMEEAKKEGYDLRSDAIPIVAAKASRDIASDYLYKTAYEKQKGHYIGCRSAKEDPKLVWAANVLKMQNDRLYKKAYNDHKAKISIPGDMVSINAAKEGQALASDVDYRQYLHQWSCLPDQNDVIQARKAYDLQSDALYKADLEWLRGIGWMPQGSPEVLRVKNAQEILCDSVYRTPVVNLKYTSIVDTPDVVLAKSNAENISIPKYREVWDKDKTSVHIMPDTPEINLARANALNVSNKLYREGWDEMKAGCDVRLDAIPIQAAKASREIASDYKYKLDHEKQKGHYVGTRTARDDNKIRWALIADKLQNEREYRLDWAKWKAKIQSPADMLSVLHSKNSQALVSDVDYRNYLHQWTCMPDQNDVIQAKKAYELQSDNVYKADLEWLRGIGWMPNDSVSVNHAKHAADIFSEKKYRTKIETLNFTPVDDRVDYVTAKQSGEILDDIKYRKDWNDTKSKYTLTETPLLHTAQEAARILDQYLYKEGWERQKATGYILPPDAVPFVHAHHSSDVQSELKYRADHVKQKGHYVGVPTMRDDPKLVWFEHAGQIQNERLYKEDYHKTKAKINIPADMKSVLAAKEGQTLVSDIDYRNYLHQWTCHPDQNDVIQARKAYDLQSDNIYKADLEWLRGIGWIPLDSVDHVRVTKNQEMMNQIKYKKNALDNYPNFTSVVDPPEIVLAKINSVNQSDVKYKETFNKAKGKYTFSPDTPHISHSRDMGKLYSTILYKGAWEGTKAYGYTLDERYIPIVGAKHADLVNSELKYKETYEKQKGHYLAGKVIGEFPGVVHCLDFQQMRSALNYRKHYEDTKANVHIPNDMMNHVLAKKCQYILSDLEYRHYFHQWTSLPEEPNVIRVRNAQEILSDNVYKDDLNWLKGIGCYVWDTPQILHAKKSYDLQSQLQYTAAGKENLQNYNLVTDTPVYVTAVQSGINASEVKYKENYHQIKDKYTTVLETVDSDRTRNLKNLYSSNLYKEAWDRVKATSYILPSSTLSLTHAKNQKHLASHVKYREEYEKFKALYTLPRSVDDDPNTARCLRVGKLNIDRLYRSVYEKNKMKIHIVPDMVEMVTAKDSQKKVSEIDYRLHLHEWICHPDLKVNDHVRKVTDQISDIVYKDDLNWLKGIGCYVWDTPEILHAKHAYDLRDDIKYKAHMLKTRNDYKLVTDTPVYVQAVKSGKQLSDAVYHYDYVHSVRGKVAPTTKTVDLDRALHAYKLQSSNLYKTSLRTLPTGYRLPGDTPHFKHIKDTRYMSSYFKYKEAYEHTKAYGYTLGPKDVPFVHVRRVNSVTSERLYRELYHKLKDKIHTTPDTPEIRQVKKTQEAVSELIYKSDFFKMQGHMISLPYTPQVIHCRYVGDITSDIKYKEDLRVLKGFGCFLYDTPDMVRSRHLRKLWSNYLYTDKARKMRDKYKVVLDTPEYRKVQELKTHLSELVYRAAGKKQKSIFTSVPDTPDLLRAKRGQKLQSQYLYVELATKERPHHHAGNQTTALKHAKDVKDMVSEKKYKIQYEKMKDKYTPVPDTPILIRAKRAYWNASDLRYKETFQKTKGKYHTVKDALDIVYHRKVTDDISKIKYKENYMSQLGIWRSIPDRPEHFHHRAVTDAVSDVKYKEDLTWLKGIGCYAYDTPDFTLAEKNKTLYSKYKYKEVFERTKSDFKYVADCPINRHFKYATQLMNEKKYRADYEQRKDKYHLVVDEPRHLLAKTAGDQISQIKYRKNYEKSKDKFTSIVDTPEHLRTTKVNKQISDILYKLEYNKAKPRGYTTIHDTPMLLHVRKVKDEVSDLKYKEVYQRNKSNCTIEPDAVHIKAAKDAYKVNTNLDYKKQYEATKAHWKWTPDRPDFLQAAKSSLQQSDFEYKLDREFLKGCKLSVTDDKNTVLALRNTLIESDLKYKEKHVKERGTCHAVPDTPQILLAKTVSHLVSENKYKDHVKKHLAQGSYTTLPETRDTVHVKEVTKHVSDTNYKKKFVKEKGKSNYSIMLEPPEVKHAMEVAKKQSDVAYRKDAKENLHYTTVADRPDIKKATQAAKQASEVEYRAKHRKEGSHGLSMLGRPDIEMAKKAAKLSSQVKYRENFDKEKGKTPKYNPKDSQLYKVMKDANNLASEVKYKADLKKLHKPVTDMKESLIMNHVLNTSQLASSYQYKKKYEKSKGHYHTIPDNLEQLHLKEATELQSIVKYKEKYEKERGKPMLDFETPTYITAKESQQMQSGKEYRKDYEESIKGRNLTGLEVTPALLHVKYATKIASEKEYRKDLEESIRGKGLTEMEDTPDMLRAKNATQILNEKEYKRDLELEVKGRGLNAMANETPDFMRARNATDIASQIKYKQSAEMEKANFTSVVDTPEILHAQQVKNLSSQKKYKEDAEKSMSYYETVLDTPEMQRVRENQKNFSLLQYQCDLKNSKGKITVVQDTPEILRVKENQKNFSSVLYKEDVSPGTAIGKTPEMMRVKQTQDHISSVKYKEAIGQGTPIPDLPEVKRVKETQKHISSVMYKENLGTGIPTTVTPEIERVKRNQENFSSVLYKENLGKGIPTAITPEMERVKRNQENFSSILYKENLSKGTPLPVTPEMERVKLNQENFSSVLYKENVGKGIPIPITPEMERVKHNQENFSSVLYKENLGTGIPIPITPEMQRVKHNQENLSSVLYKENMGKGTPLPVTPEMERVKHNQENISSVLYKENMGKGTPLPVTPEMERVKHNQENISSVLYKENMGKGTPLPVTPEMERVKHNQENISSVLYKENVGKATPTPVTPEMQRVKRNQENISSVLYKENMRKATPTPVTPEMERAKRNQENISSVLYSDSFRKQIQGKAAYVLDTPEMRRVRETQRHISTVKYHEDFEKHKGCFTPVVTDPITERVKKNMQDFSDINYRGIQRKVVEMEQKRNDQDQETITGLRVWRTNPGSVFDYDPAEDNIQSRSLHMINVQAQRRSREQSRSASALSISGGEEKSEHSEAPDHHLSTYSDGGVFAVSTAYKHAKTTELPQQRSSSVATQQTTVSSIPSHPSTAGKIFRAMYDYMAADADEVSFKDGDAIINVQAIDEGWMYGTVQRTGRTGMLPANYVEAI
ncbi:nebulin isoform X41 [Macaca thibetana thibetana]|uniref:nebulin isoform X41 n=1 Tax=Macaca thibetana thibetana TaxID=257877 RepID=UPI0021BC5CBE|nr:nebulin isoform X41 [Macaca thibetana thibetana]